MTPSDPELDAAWLDVRRGGRDATPRHRLAALLTARGDPFGEFLRICLTEGAHVDDATRRADAESAERLLALHGDAWFPYEPWDKAQSVRRWTTFVGRGMPDSAAVFRSGPPAREVLTWFTARYPLRRLALVEVDPTEALTFVEEAGLFSSLADLDLSGCTITDAAVAVLERAHAGPLTLQLTKPIGLEGMRAERLFCAHGLDTVTELGVATTALDHAALRAIWRGLPHLERLRLYQVVFERALLTLPGRRRILDLSVDGQPADGLVLEIMRNLDLTALKHLKLQVGGALAGCFELLRDSARAGSLGALALLDLEKNYVSDDELATLLTAPPPAMKRLVLSGNSISKRGMEALAAWARTCSTLKSLPISGNFIGSGVMEEGSDWDGTVVGSYEKGLTTEEVRAKFGFPATLPLH